MCKSKEKLTKEFAVFHGGWYGNDCREHIATNSPILNGELPYSPDLFPNDYYLSFSLWTRRGEEVEDKSRPISPAELLYCGNEIGIPKL